MGKKMVIVVEVVVAVGLITRVIQVMVVGMVTHILAVMPMAEDPLPAEVGLEGVTGVGLKPNLLLSM